MINSLLCFCFWYEATWLLNLAAHKNYLDILFIIHTLGPRPRIYWHAIESVLTFPFTPMKRLKLAKTRSRELRFRLMEFGLSGPGSPLDCSWVWGWREMRSWTPCRGPVWLLRAKRSGVGAEWFCEFPGHLFAQGKLFTSLCPSASWSRTLLFNTVAMI